MRSSLARLCRFNAPTNVRPDNWNSHDNCKGDCTTRAITYALNGEMTYAEVEKEQYRLAAAYGTHRNTTGTYDQILVNRGWRWIQFSKCVSRGEVAVYLAKSLGKDVTALTLSRTHIAAVKNGELIDTWDSRGGKVFAVLVPEEWSMAAIVAIKQNASINCTLVPKSDSPNLVRSRRIVHRYYNRYW